MEHAHRFQAGLGNGINIKRSTLDVRKAGFYRIKIFGYKFVRKYLNVATVRLVTVRSNPGPEYLVLWGLPYDGVFLDPTDGPWDGNNYLSTLQRVDTWSNQDIKAMRIMTTQQPATLVSCPRMRSYKHLEKGVVSFWIPVAVWDAEQGALERRDATSEWLRRGLLRR